MMKNISAVAKQVGLSTKTIRYYESIALTSEPVRGDNGYRYYNQRIIDELSFVKRARDAGFNLEECKELVHLYNSEERTAAQVKALTLEKIADIESRIAILQGMHSTLLSLASACKGDNSSQCAILDQLSVE
ncbi:MAG: MerR family copper efflux transcriptional regulator [Moritella dasanensis]|jgi:MerR family copper efflux transcriptional regulator